MDGSITVFGGTGFIGRHLVPLLLRSGATVRLAVRHPGRVQMTTELAKVPEIVQADVLDDIAVDAAIAGTDRRQSRRHSDRDDLTELSRHPRRSRAPSCAGSTSPWRDAANPLIGSRRQSDISRDLGPDEGRGRTGRPRGIPAGNDRPAEPRVWRG